MTSLLQLNLGTHRDLLVVDAPSSFEPGSRPWGGDPSPRREVGEGDRVRSRLREDARRGRVGRLPGRQRRSSGSPIRRGRRNVTSASSTATTGWAAAEAAGFESVRMVAIDEDESALRFRRSEFVKSSKGWPPDRESVETRASSSAWDDEDGGPDGFSMDRIRSSASQAEPRRIVFDAGMVTGLFPLGRPEDYASLKANLFPEEGGPVLVMDVPEHIVEKTFIDRKPVDRGVVQFDEGAGLEELRPAWPMLTKTASPGVP